MHKTDMETVKPETIKPETIKPETIKPETVKAETVKAETVKAETVKADSIPAEIQDAEYQALLDGIVAGAITRRRDVVKAFRSAMNCLFFRKDTARLDALAKILPVIPEKAKIEKAIIAFSGGCIRNTDGNCFSHPEKSCIMKEKVKGTKYNHYMLVPERFDSALAFYKQEFQSLDYDCLHLMKEKPTAIGKDYIFSLLEKVKKDTTERGTNMPKVFESLIKDLELYSKVNNDLEFSNK